VAFRERKAEQHSIEQARKLDAMFRTKGKVLSAQQLVLVQKFLRLLADSIVENYLSERYGIQQNNTIHEHSRPLHSGKHR
jgi:hypothetical protein